MSKGRGRPKPVSGAVTMSVGCAEVEEEDVVEGEEDEPGRTTGVKVAAAGFAVDVEENLRRLSEVVLTVPLGDSSMFTLSWRRYRLLCTGVTGYLLSYTISPGPK